MQHASRKKTRRFLAQKLYARIYQKVDEQMFQQSFFDGILDFTIDQEYFDEMFQIIIKKQRVILGIIEKFAPRFDIDSMLKTNILALCIAISEMLYLKEEVPAKVSINEAIEITKYFGDDHSKKIVNGILNSFLNNIEDYQKNDTTIRSQSQFFI